MKPVQLGFLALALLAGTAGYTVHQFAVRNGAADGAVTAAPEAPPEAPPASVLEWSFADLEGRSQALSQWRGRIVVLNFWATWCPPCLREIPAFIELQQRYGDEGVQFIGIALDQVEAVRPFVEEKSMNYPVLVGDQDVVRLMQSLGNAVGGLPYTAVIDRAGELVATHQGEWDAADAAAELVRQLSGKAAAEMQ